MLKAVKKLSVQ